MYHSQKRVSINDFDQKLAEVDAYLQLLIEQTEKLDKKIELASSDQERDGLVAIKNKSDKLLGSIKHAIVLLQIAKVTVKALPPKSTADSPTSSSYVANPSLSSPNSSGASSASPNAGSSIKAPLRRKDKTKDKDKRKQVASGAARPDKSRFSLQSSSDLAATTCSDTCSTNNNIKQQQQQPYYRHSIATEALVDNPNSISTTAAAAPSSLSFKEQLGLNNLNQQRQKHNEQQIVNSSDDDEPFYDADDDTPAIYSETALQGHFANNLTLNSTEHNLANSGNLNSSTSIQSFDSPVLSKGANHSNEVDIVDGQSSAISTQKQKSLTQVENMDGSIDWESLYEEEEEDLGSLENHGSVIKHLMSQIRIGMDLTKVVLPTFILERRSLLEMYADFFAHPDLFSSIPDYETPEERMIQVVRWYLSAFHAGRKSSVAKKPYNPILGEIFRCHWTLQNDTNDDSIDESGGKNANANNIDIADSYIRQQELSTPDLDKEFPSSLPEDSLIFVAEQVSHHPPVSAFYAENKAKRITCCAHIYTKSKYLGLSVGVSNIGQGTIDLLDYKETYTCTFPSAFGRSILTVPWVELGGSVTIKCAQTQYSANIEFVTKPFYGGKKHRILGEILRPNNEPILSIDGEWNAIMFSKRTASGDKEIFVDTTSLPVIRKHVRPICTQETYESRNVWKEVTRALKIHDVTNATEAKTFIEQKQREALKDRQEKGIKWETKYFDPSDDGWRFTKPLEFRLNLTNDQ